MDAGTTTGNAGLPALAQALADAIAAERAYLAVLEAGFLRTVASCPDVPLPASVAVASLPALAKALSDGETSAADEELAGLFGGEAHLLLPLPVTDEVQGMAVLVDSPMPAGAALDMLAGAVPLAAAHLATWWESERRLQEIGDEIAMAWAMRRVADVMTDAIRVIDLDGRVVRWNKASEHLLGWTEEEVLGTVLPSIPADRKAGFLAQVRNMAMTMQPTRQEIESLRKDGSRVRHSLHAYPILDEHGEFLVIAVSREIAADSRVDRLRDEFCDLVSGSLKGPLTAITGFGQLLRRTEILDDQQRRQRVLDALQAQTGVLGTMIDDLLLLSEVQHGALRLERTAVDLVTIVTQSVAEAERAHPGSRFVVDVESRLPRLPGDTQRLRQALAHLLANAATYSAPRGEVWVTVARDGTHSTVTVRDDGEGVPAEDLPHVFERFVRGSRARGRGTGVGLHVVRLIAEAHGGCASIESDWGKGCRAILRLPLLD
ncbi:MAG TPA: ATP-binding protein [Coriobacteriia bacterium]